MKVELLAPAGSYQAMKAAFKAGADAVYLGGEKFGARAYAQNLSTEEMLEAIDYAHLYGKKLYLTVNTLLKDIELKDELYTYLVPFYQQGLDAVIVQDVGVLKLIKEMFPDLPIHASTQMAITGVASADLLRQSGASRIVMPRELLLKEITDIHQQVDIEIEGFVHGALCYSYSGQCLFSSFLGGRSGNRGRCAGPCRLPYVASQANQVLSKQDEQYLLNTKDICTVKLLPEIIAAGVTSLKIEGRMKKSEYTAGVVSVYRKYLDIALDSNRDYQVDQRDYQELLDLYNRDGFSQGYYQCRNGRELMAFKNEKVDFRGKAIISKRNEALFVRLRRNYIDEKAYLPVKGIVELYVGKPLKLTVTYQDMTVTAELDLVQLASKQPISPERIKEQLHKTGGTHFSFMTLDIIMDDNIFIAIQSLNELRRQALSQLEAAITKVFYRNESKAIATTVCRNEPKGRLFPTAENNNTSSKPLGPLITAVVATAEQLAVLYDEAGISALYAEVGIFVKGDFKSNVIHYIGKMKAADKGAYLALPYVLRGSSDLAISKYFDFFIERGLSGFLVRNIEGYAQLAELGLAQYVSLDYQVYTLNEYAQKFWYEKSIISDTASPELNIYELKKRDNSKSEIVIYGYAPMMITANCLKKSLQKCTKDFAVLDLTDRYQKKFKVKCDCDFCYNIIYNSIATGLLKEQKAVMNLGFKGFRLDFSTENKAKTRAIARTFVAVYSSGNDVNEQLTFTKGHFKRGIE